MRSDRGFLIAAVLLVIDFAVGLVVSIELGWAYEFGGIGDPNNVSGQWVEKGTYLAPPLAPALVFLVGLGMPRLRGLLGVAGVVLTMLVGLVFLIGIFGEPWKPRGFDPPLGVVILFRVWSVAAIVGVLVLGPLSLRVRRRSSAEARA